MNKLEADTAYHLGRAEAFLEIRLRDISKDIAASPLGCDAAARLQQDYDDSLAELEKVRREIRALNMEYNADKDRLDREIGRE